MKKFANTIAVLFIIIILLIVLAPITFFVSILLIPIWKLFEEYIDIETVGHSGPAIWCFIVTYVLLLLLAIPLMYRIRKNKRELEDEYKRTHQQ